MQKAITMALIGGWIGIWIYRYVEKNQLKKGGSVKEYYKVTFFYHHQRVEAKALLDTGNFLYEPISHMPVSIVEASVLEPCFTEKHKINGIRMIPYRSIGMEHGMMPGILVKEIRIRKKNRVWYIEKGMIGITKVQMTSKNQYQMLLHPDFIKK